MRVAGHSRRSGNSAIGRSRSRIGRCGADDLIRARRPAHRSDETTPHAFGSLISSETALASCGRRTAATRRRAARPRRRGAPRAPGAERALHVGELVQPPPSSRARRRPLLVASRVRPCPAGEVAQRHDVDDAEPQALPPRGRTTRARGPTPSRGLGRNGSEARDPRSSHREQRTDLDERGPPRDRQRRAGARSRCRSGCSSVWAGCTRSRSAASATASSSAIEPRGEDEVVVGDDDPVEPLELDVGHERVEERELRARSTRRPCACASDGARRRATRAARPSPCSTPRRTSACDACARSRHGRRTAGARDGRVRTIASAPRRARSAVRQRRERRRDALPAGSSPSARAYFRTRRFVSSSGETLDSLGRDAPVEPRARRAGERLRRGRTSSAGRRGLRQHRARGPRIAAAQWPALRW